MGKLRSLWVGNKEYIDEQIAIYEVNCLNFQSLPKNLFGLLYLKVKCKYSYWKEKVVKLNIKKLNLWLTAPKGATPVN